MADGDRLLGQLEELGINKDNYRVLALLPLVLVAWADGKVQSAELGRMLDIARRQGFLPASGAAVFEGWLVQKPSEDYVRKSLAALVELARRKRGVGADLSAIDLRQLSELSFDIAVCAGGLWGDVFSVTADEEQTVGELAQVLNIDSGQSWKELLEDLS
jgi:hypothetical protein